jgi:hypothetical protein
MLFVEMSGGSRKPIIRPHLNCNRIMRKGTCNRAREREGVPLWGTHVYITSLKPDRPNRTEERGHAHAPAQTE